MERDSDEHFISKCIKIIYIGGIGRRLAFNSDDDDDREI
jgi:hypothetical protein